MKPYFGITDFAMTEQVHHIHAIFEGCKPTPDHMLHVGVMMSRKTLRGLSTKWAGSWPHLHEYREIFSVDHPSVYNCLHYADFGEPAPYTYDDMCAATRLCGWSLDAIQLDMIWPTDSTVRKFKERQVELRMGERKFEVILQVGRVAFRYLNGSPDELVDRLACYAGGVDRVLLDMSGGMGIPMDAEKFLPFIELIRLKLPHLGVVVAGGLSRDTMIHMIQIWDKDANVSIDAQGALRASRNAMDPIDWPLAIDYLHTASELNKLYQKQAA